MTNADASRGSPSRSPRFEPLGSVIACQSRSRNASSSSRSPFSQASATDRIGHCPRQHLVRLRVLGVGRLPADIGGDQGRYPVSSRGPCNAADGDCVSDRSDVVERELVPRLVVTGANGTKR